MSPMKDETRVMQCSGREGSVSKATLVIRMSTVSNRLHGSGKANRPHKDPLEISGQVPSTPVIEGMGLL